MKKLEGYTKYPFEGVRVGRSKFAMFVLILIERLIASGDAAYAAIIAELQTAYQTMFGEIAKWAQDLNQQMSDTNVIKTIRKNWDAIVDEVDSAVRFKFGKSSEVHLKFFPHGVTPFKDAPLFDLLIKMEELEELCQEYQGDLGDDLVNKVTAIKTTFEQERNDQLQSIGKVKSIIPNYEEKKESMIKLTYKAMLKILTENIDNPRVMLTFFEEKLIYPHHRQMLNVVIEPQKRVAPDIDFKPGYTLILTHVKGGDLKYFFAPSPDSPVPENPDILTPNEEVEIKYETIPPIDKVLIIVNANNAEAEVEIAVEH